MSDDDGGHTWSTPELVRNVLRLDKRIDDLADKSVNESTYLQAQKNTGERFEDLIRRVTTIETKRESEGEARAAEYRRNVWVVIAAGIAFFGSLALAVLQLVAK